LKLTKTPEQEKHLAEKENTDISKSKSPGVIWVGDGKKGRKEAKAELIKSEWREKKGKSRVSQKSFT